MDLFIYFVLFRGQSSPNASSAQFSQLLSFFKGLGQIEFAEFAREDFGRTTLPQLLLSIRVVLSLPLGMMLFLAQHLFVC